MAVLPTPMMSTRLADLVDVAERDGLEPGNADVNAVGIVPAGQFQLLALRRARADEDGRELPALEQLLHAVDGRIQPQISAHIDDVADFLIQHVGRQAECGNVGAHQAARHAHIARKSSPRSPAAARSFATVSDAGPAPMQAIRLPFFSAAPRGSSARDVVAMIGSDALQSADGHGLLFDAAATAGGFAGPVADPAQNSGKHVGLAIHHVGFGELALSDQPDVLGNVGMRGASPLAVYHSMEVIRFCGIGRFHVYPLMIARMAAEV